MPSRGGILAQQQRLPGTDDAEESERNKQTAHVKG